MLIYLEEGNFPDTGCMRCLRQCAGHLPAKKAFETHLPLLPKPATISLMGGCWSKTLATAAMSQPPEFSFKGSSPGVERGRNVTHHLFLYVLEAGPRDFGRLVKNVDDLGRFSNY